MNRCLSPVHASMYEQAHAVRDQPDKPHADAQPMEATASALAAADHHYRRPHRVEQHEYDREHPGGRMERRASLRRQRASDGGHEGRARRVARKSQSEQRQMALFERSRTPLAKHAEGIEDERSRDCHGRRLNYRVHIQTSERVVQRRALRSPGPKAIVETPQMNIQGAMFTLRIGTASFEAVRRERGTTPRPSAERRGYSQA